MVPSKDTQFKSSDSTKDVPVHDSHVSDKVITPPVINRPDPPIKEALHSDSPKTVIPKPGPINPVTPGTDSETLTLKRMAAIKLILANGGMDSQMVERSLQLIRQLFSEGTK